MPPQPWRGNLAALLLILPGAVLAETSPPLPSQDRLIIEQSLGRGVVGKPAPAPVIDDPARYLAATEGVWLYRVIKGASGKSTERDTWHRTDRTHWNHDTDGQETAFIATQPDGSLVVTGLRDIKDDALTRYTPPEPLLLNHLRPEEERHFAMGVQVYDPDDLAQPVHEGRLEVGYRYVGAYRLATPSGHHEAVLFKYTYHGTVGPATIEDVQYRFFARDVGLVGMIERREVSAFLVYNLRRHTAKLLVERPAER